MHNKLLVAGTDHRVSPCLRGSGWTWKPRLGAGIVWRQLGRPAPPPEPFYPALPPRPLPEGRVSATCKLCQRSPAGARVSLRDSRVPLGAPAPWVPSPLPAAAVASSKADSGSPFSPPSLLRAGSGAGVGGLLFGAGAGGHPARGQRESARVCVLDCSSDSGGRGRGGGGDASRRAGEAGGGAKWKPGSREPGAQAGWRAGGRAALRVPRAATRPRARGHPAGGWRGRGAAGAGGGWAPGSGRLASRSPPRALPRSLPGLPVSRPSSPRRRRQQRASTRRAPRAEPQRCPRLTPYVPPGPPAAVRGARQLAASTESYCFLAQVCCRTHGGE
ncbi:translation initiation factor IF-2-like [Mustela putorius furo]|uniref:Translation initiation factor IF-2-like n=1 Tax=Mustela putorius furo TaxID=9669 RepID=A0A8U0UXU1_MUSPF|nr:translation initiation factor IF-2-like [Mustela putorius furo]